VAKLPQTKTEPKTQIEHIRDVSPKYAALVTRQEELIARYDEIQAEVNPRGWVRGTFNEKTGAVTYGDVPLGEQARTQPAWTAQLPRPVVKPVVRDAAAVALLGDLLPEQLPEEIAPQPLPPSWPGQDRYRALGAELESIQAALKLIAPEISKERKQYSRLVAAQCADEYKAMVTNIVDIAKGLGEAMLAHAEFLNQLRLDGVAYAPLLPLNLSAFGSLSEQHTPLLAVIIDAIEKKHVDGGKLPSWKMPAPIEYFNGGN
jgi:hypothetical protein